MAIADGFHVDSNGNLWLGSDRETFDATTRSEAPFYVYASGDLVANSGTFSGNVSGSTITGGSINIGNGTFQVDSSGNLTATSASISGVISAGGAANDINNNSTQISGGKIQANSLDVNSVITNDLSFTNLSISSQNIIDTLVNNAILDTITSGAISDTKLGNISANKITAGTMSADRISGGSINANIITGAASLTGLNVTANGIGVIGGISLNNSDITQAADITANGTISGGTISGSSISGGTVSGSTGTFSSTVKGSQFQSSSNSSNVGFGTNHVYLRGGGSTDFAANASQNTSYRHLRPSGYNTLDLGSSGSRWRDIYTLGAVDTSDINLKTDVEPLALGLDFLNTLDTIQFKWAETEESPAGVRTHAGFSAQDIEQKLIDYGVQSKDYALFTNSQITEGTDDPIYGLRTKELISILTKSIQELSAKNDELESRLAALEG